MPTFGGLLNQLHLSKICDPALFEIFQKTKTLMFKLPFPLILSTHPKVIWKTMIAPLNRNLHPQIQAEILDILTSIISSPHELFAEILEHWEETFNDYSLESGILIQHLIKVSSNKRVHSINLAAKIWSLEDFGCS